jgi:hypothetical protein
MGCNPGSARHPWRLGLALASWLLAALAAQGPLGGEIAGAARQFEQRIQLRFESVTPTPDAQPARSHDDESLDPWELVRV